MNKSVPHAELIATFRRAEVDAAHKLGLIKAVGNKGPKAIQAAVETAATAVKRRDSLWWSSNFGQFDRFFCCRFTLESVG